MTPARRHLRVSQTIGCRSPYKTHTHISWSITSTCIVRVTILIFSQGSSFGSGRGRKFNWLVSLFLYQFSSKLLSFLDCSWELYQRKGGFGLWQQFSDVYKALSIFHQGSCKSSTPWLQSMLHLLLFQTAHWMYHPMRADVYNTCAQVSITPARRCYIHLRAGVYNTCAPVLPSQICIL